MDEQNTILEPGVETEVVAVPEETAVPENAETTPPAPEAEPDLGIKSKVEEAFAKRLSKEREKLKAEIEDQYTPYKKILERGAKEAEMSFDEYVQALLTTEEESTEEHTPIPKEYKEILDDLKAEREAKKKADEEHATETETQMVLDEYTKRMTTMLVTKYGITEASQIPEEVWAKADADGTDVFQAYVEWDKQKSIKEAEAKTIEKIQKQGTPGSLSGNFGTEPTIDIFSMSPTSKEFDQLLNDVRRGKVKL